MSYDWYHDPEQQKLQLNPDHTQYIKYEVGLWHYDALDYKLVEYLSIHKCNDTDKQLISQNERPVYFDWAWQFFYCLDNPERIKLRQEQNGNSIILEIHALYCEGSHCKTEREIQSWSRKKKGKGFNLITNKQMY